MVSWNALIDALVQFGEFETALKLFVQLQELFEPDGYTIQSVLNAYAGLCALSLGIWVHVYLLRKFDVDVTTDILVNNCLVDMYCNCGSLLAGNAEPAASNAVKFGAQAWQAFKAKSPATGKGAALGIRYS